MCDVATAGANMWPPLTSQLPLVLSTSFPQTLPYLVDIFPFVILSFPQTFPYLQDVAGGYCRGQHVNGAHPCGQQRLMGVAHGGVCDQHPLVLPHCAWTTQKCVSLTLNEAVNKLTHPAFMLFAVFNQYGPDR